MKTFLYKGEQWTAYALEISAGSLNLPEPIDETIVFESPDGSEGRKIIAPKRTLDAARTEEELVALCDRAETLP